MFAGGYYPPEFGGSGRIRTYSPEGPVLQTSATLQLGQPTHYSYIGDFHLKVNANGSPLSRSTRLYRSQRRWSGCITVIDLAMFL